MKKIFAGIIIFQIIFLFFSEINAQYLKSNEKKLISIIKDNKTSTGPEVYLGFYAGFALMEQESGLAVGLFAELGMSGFAIVPQANFWKTDNQSNFEIAGLARLRFKSVGIEPYLDGGIGLNFYQAKFGLNSETFNATKLGLDVGGGIDNIVISKNFTVFLDGKYKFIVNEDKVSEKISSNIKGFNITAGMKFSFK